MKLFGFFLRKSAMERDLDREVAFHLESLIEEKIAAGCSPKEARRLAALEFGGAEQVKEECRSVHRVPVIETTLGNLKAALRFVRKSPGFSVAVILTLGLGIGANSAVFSAIDAVILRALPYPQADQLVVLRQYDRNSKRASRPIAPIRLEEWNRYNSSFRAIAGAYTQDISETSGSVPERLVEADVTPRFLEVLGVSPELGRDFTPVEEHAGGPPVVLISDRFWKRRFHADPHALGRVLRIEMHSAQIVGVLPPNFNYPDRSVDVWWPVPMDSPLAQNRFATWFTGIGRLKPGIDIRQAKADLSAVQARLGRQFPESDKDLSPELQPLKETLVAGSRRSLGVLFAAVTLLLVIACANIAGLLLSRITERSREISIRYSLGASRTAIVTQLLTEVLVLALSGSIFGLAIAAGGIRLLRALAKALPRTESLALDWRVAGYTFFCAVVAALLCGLVPAIVASKRSISSALASNGRTQVSARAPLQWTLVGVQVALAAMLLVGAGLLLRTFQELGRVSPGFDPEHILTLRISGNYGETSDQQRMFQRMKRTVEALSSVPGVESAAISATVPGDGFGFPAEVRVTDDAALGNRKITADEKLVYGPYFATMRIPVLAGTTCKRDTLWTTAVVNRSFVEAFFAGRTPIGHHLEITQSDSKPEIIGVVADVRENGVSHEAVPTLYWCSSNADPSPYFLIRTKGDPMALAQTLQREIQHLEPTRSVFAVAPLKELLFDSNLENRFRTLLLTAFAGTAILLAAIGLYGTLSYLVTLRRREIGLRIALGASAARIRHRFIAQGASVSLAGCAIGLALGAAFSRLLAGMLYAVSRLDPVTYLGVAISVFLVAALASGLPASRAARLDPMQVLREE